MRGRDATAHPTPFLATTRVAAALWLATLLIPCLLTACGASRAADTDHADPTNVRAGEPLRVIRGRLAPRLLLTGELEAAEAVTLATPNADLWPAQIQWLAEDGAQVEAGDVVVEFDITSLLSNIEEMHAAVIEAENRLISEQARVASEVGSARFEVEQKRAERDKARLEAEIPAEFFSAKEYAERQLTLERAELQLADAERQLKTTIEAGEAEIEVQRIALTKAIEAVEKAERNARRLVLTAPRAGIFLVGEERRSNRRLRPGDSTWPGHTVGRLPDLETLRVRARLFDVDDGRVRDGQRVVARLDAFPERPIEGRVTAVDDIAEQPFANSLRRFFDVEIELDEIDPQWMRPGMSVEVVVADETREETLLVPRAALDWRDGTPRVRRAGAAPTTVELGACDAFYCALTAPSALEEGDVLAPVTDDEPEAAS